jgi:hypothetical protein
MEISVIDSNKKVHKCPDYILKARKNYYYRQKENPEFIEKEKKRNKIWRDANRDRINEKARILRQKKKAEEKAKQEKLTSNETITSNEAKEDLPNLEKLTV